MTAGPLMSISAPMPEAPRQISSPRRWVLLASLAIVFFTLFALYAAVLAVLLPNQIQNIAPHDKTRALGIVFAITSVFSTLVTPIAGALSDRTRTRFGRRAPWIFIGATVGAISLSIVPMMTSLVMITLFWVGAVVALNAMQPAITTVVADRFAASQRGLASGVVGASMTAGLSAGVILAGQMSDYIAQAYWLFAGAVAAASLLFVLLNPEATPQRIDAAPFRIGAFLKGFWIDPRQHPDFGWAFLSRFTIYMGYQAISTYLLYILQDHIGLSQGGANHAISVLSTITFAALVVAGLGSGWVSDRIGRRKPLVAIAGVIMAAAVAMPLVTPSMQGMIAYAALIGVGYGAFMSVDLALMTEVLPKTSGGDDATGKDLGILTTAVNVPQILSPVMAAWLLTATDNNYPLLFGVAGLLVLAGSLFVLPIRSVR